MKGQSSMELFVTIAIVLAFTVPVLFLLFSLNSVGYENTAKAQAESSSRSLAEAADFVFAQGNGAKRVVVLNLPSSTESLQAKSGEIIITIKTSSGNFEAVSPTIANISSNNKNNYYEQNLKAKSGLLPITLVNNNGKVELSAPG
ncbi:hypothetical protein HY988_00705 [Candidatus Micrarchaeota archaeon]|nr:hypothetical protein [Candidatus Micrarchaeota archaeon]